MQEGWPGRQEPSGPARQAVPASLPACNCPFKWSPPRPPAPTTCLPTWPPARPQAVDPTSRPHCTPGPPTLPVPARSTPVAAAGPTASVPVSFTSSLPAYFIAVAA